MSSESHNLRVGIDASQAKRGSAAYTAAVGKIIQATRDFEKMNAQLGKSASKSGSFNAIARDLQKLNNLRLSPSLAKNVQSLSDAMRNMRGPSSTSVKNMRTLFRELGKAKVNASLAGNIGRVTAALSNFRGPTRGGVTNTTQLFRVLASARINTSLAGNIATISAALNNFRGPSPTAARSVQQLASSLSALRVPKGLGGLNNALGNLGNRFGSAGGAAVRLGGSVNGIPWGRAGSGAIQLTGNLRGLENAMSLSYQMGSQLRMLFGALTVSGFTAGVIEATTASDRLKYVLQAVSDTQKEVTDQMEYAETVSRRYGLNYLEVERNLGRFTAATRTAGLTAEQSNYIFESLGRQSRLFGLDIQQQARAMLAITQGFQKGTVRAEEFRSQLGEQLPVWQFMVEAVAELKGIDPSKVDLNKMMEMGQLGPDAYVLLFQKMDEKLGAGIADSMRHPLVAMENLRTSWTKFLELVGKAGVMDALARAANSITEVMDSPAFQGRAAKVAEALGTAIIKVGEAAAWAIDNVDTLGKVFALAVGARLVGTITSVSVAMGVMIGQFGSLIGLGARMTGIPAAFGMMASGIKTVATGAAALTLSLGKIGPLVAAAWAGLKNFTLVGAAIGGVSAGFTGIVAGAKKFGAIALSVGKGVATLFKATLVGGLIALGVALAENWNNMITLGDHTASVGEIAMQVFQKIGEWASEAGNFAMKVFAELANGISYIFTGQTTEMNENATDWLVWGNRLIGVIEFVVGSIRVAFSSMWEGLKDLAITGWDSITGVFTGADQSKLWAGYFQRAAVGVQQLTADSNALMASMGDAWNDPTKGRLGAYIKLAEEAREAASAADDAWKNRNVDTTAPSLSTDGLNPILGDKEGTTKAGKAVADALDDYREAAARLKSQLDAGSISLQQYNEALEYQKGKLEETVDPYAAMVRTMQEENNILRLNGKEQRLASAFQEKKNQLLEKGIALTAHQTEELKKLIAEQDKLNNPSPLKAWVDGMQEFGDAIETAGVSAMESLSSSLADLIVDGKADWQSLAKQILKDLVKISLNEAWKGIFGTKEVQQTVNAALSGPDGMKTLADMNTPANNATVMAGAVAQGIAMAGTGMQGGIATGGLFNDPTVASLSAPSVTTNELFGAPSGAASSGFTAINPVGAGAGSFTDFSKTFGNGANTIAAASTNFATGAESIVSNVAQAAGGAGKMLSLSNRDVELMARVANTEWDRAGGGDPKQLKGILDTMMNRAATPGNAYGQSSGMEGVLNKRWQFSAINAPRGTGIVGKYGSADNAPLDPKVFDLTKQYIAERANGAQSIVGEGTHYLNPKYSSASSLNQWGNNVVGQANQTGMKFGANANNMHYHGVAPGAPTPGQYGVQYGGMGGGMPPLSAAGMTSGGGVSGLPGGMGSAYGGGISSVGGGAANSLQGLGDSVKAELTPAFQQVATAIPQQFDPSLTQVAQQLPQKFTEQGDQFGQQLLTAAQPGNMQAAQDSSQKYMQANSQAAQDFAMKMQSASAGVGGGGGGGGGIGGMLMGALGTFASVGAVVGQSGGTRRPMSTLLGDPDAEPIVAHRGELITPAQDVDRMRRLGRDAMLLDNAAVSGSQQRSDAGGSSSSSSSSGGSSSAGRNAAPRPIVNFHIVTPNADSFRASQSQISSKAGAQAYRDSVRNN